MLFRSRRRGDGIIPAIDGQNSPATRNNNTHNAPNAPSAHTHAGTPGRGFFAPTLALSSPSRDATLGETPPTSGWGSCTKETIGRLVGLAGTDRYAAAAAMVSRHEVQGARNARPMPGLAAFLEAVADRPKAIVTLVGPEATALVLDAFGIVVDVVVPRRPDVRPKPFPDQLEEGLRLLGASADQIGRAHV